jgi:hypothetical protein
MLRLKRSRSLRWREVAVRVRMAAFSPVSLATVTSAEPQILCGSVFCARCLTALFPTLQLAWYSAGSVLNYCRLSFIKRMFIRKCFSDCIMRATPSACLSLSYVYKCGGADIVHMSLFKITNPQMHTLLVVTVNYKSRFSSRHFIHVALLNCAG